MSARERIAEKLVLVEEHTDRLENKQGVSKAEYCSDVDLQAIVERYLEVAVQACVDISRLIGKREQLAIGNASKAEVFSTLHREGILSETTSDEMIAAAGLRNVLAHQYDTAIDDEAVYAAYHDLARFRRFSEEIYQYLETAEET